MASPPSATAADPEPSPTPQQVTYNADWVEGLRPEDLSPSRAAICIVDSGVAITPDTPADNPEGPILVRDSIDPTTIPGTPPPGTSDTATHGTYMASAAIAPRNSWGTVGLYPLGRVISVRAVHDAEVELDPESVQRGVSRCLQFLGRVPRLAAVSMSFGKSAVASDAESTRFADLVLGAHRRGVSVVAASGNDATHEVEFPASVDGVLSVGAHGENGPCPYATSDVRIDIFGPGCDLLETADLKSGNWVVDGGGGSSTSTVWLAQSIALLCDLVPSLTGEQAEAALRESSRVRSGRPVLDLEAAARAVGAGATVDRSLARLTARGGPNSQPPSPVAMPPTDVPPAQQADAPLVSSVPPASQRVWPPTIRASWRRHRLIVAVSTSADRSWRVRISSYRARRRIGVTVRAMRRLLVLRPRSRPNRVCVELVPLARGIDRVAAERICARVSS